jgi:hypothetical protein
MTDFEKRLEKAIERGQHSRDAKNKQAASSALTEEELRRAHNVYRLELSEHIEQCLSRLPGHIPGFAYQTVVGDRGWGAACNRDDIGVGPDGKRANFFSRIEMVVRPYGAHHVLDLAAKGTVRNKEVYSRNNYQLLAEADVDSFKEFVDLWVLEYAELYAAG